MCHDKIHSLNFVVRHFKYNILYLLRKDSNHFVAMVLEGFVTRLYEPFRPKTIINMKGVCMYTLLQYSPITPNMLL